MHGNSLSKSKVIDLHLIKFKKKKKSSKLWRARKQVAEIQEKCVVGHKLTFFF